MDGQGITTLHLPRVLRQRVALEHDGSLHSCDHYVYPQYQLGKLTEASSSRMVFSDRQKKFGLAKFGTLPERRRECKFPFACNGECPKIG
jgi:uncharacterized protein